MNTPTRRICSPSRARAASGHAAAAPPSSVMNSRRPMKAVIWSLQPEGLGKDSTLVSPCPGFTSGTTKSINARCGPTWPGRTSRIVSVEQRRPPAAPFSGARREVVAQFALGPRASGPLPFCHGRGRPLTSSASEEPFTGSEADEAALDCPYVVLYSTSDCC